MPIITTQQLSSRAITEMIYDSIEGASKNSWVRRIGFLNMNSTQQSEDYGILSQTPQFRKWVGGRNAKRLQAQKITLVNERYEATLVDSKDNFRFNRDGLLQRRVDQFGVRSETHWAKLAVEAIELGASTLTYDGQYFFDTDHSWGDSGTIKNKLTASEYGTLNVATAAAPTAYEFSNALNDVISHFYTMKDDVGEPINEDAMKFMVLCPATMGGAARAAVSQQLLNSGSGTVNNILAASAWEVDVVATPRLTSSVVFYVFRLDSSLPALILQEKPPGLEISSKAEGSDFEHDTNQWEFGAEANRALGTFGWQSAIMATLS